jgi:hypothetical protein
MLRPLRMLTPRTDQALDLRTGVLPCVPQGDPDYQRVAESLAELRSMPSAIVRCSCVLALIDGLMGRLAAAARLPRSSSQESVDALEKLRKLRVGLEAELRQAKANAALR